ncbi:uncharacterized protein M6B38_333820 [Iris pallida]|uniref:Uncharacterized protein n=1 Tax=Iris pallida TaxID=29817 RepID=A0AAX6H2F3_IRIPA|nr:uncharacterized protein M6B38_333820 [Iris pallida]
MKRELSSSDKHSELGKNTAFRPVVENENVLLPSKSSLTCNLQHSSSRGHGIGKCSLKQESLDNSSFDLPLPRECTSCGSQRKMDDGPRFDLNIAASALDEPLSVSVMEQAGNESLGQEGLLFKNSGSVCPPMLPMKSDESDNCLRLSNLSQSTDQHSDSGISLDLQLKQPRRPGPQFSWTDTGPGIQDSGTDLSLSLAGKLSGDSPSVQPVPIKETIQKNNSVVEFSLPKLRRPTHVKSEQCEITLQDAASIGAGSMSRDPKASSLHVSLTKLTATSCCAKNVGDSVGGKISSSESKFEIDLNYKPVDSGDNMHHVPRRITASAPSEASKITEKGPSQATSHSPTPDSNESLCYDEVPKNSCFSGDARGNAEKASVFVSKSLEFEGNEFSAAKDTPTEMDASLLLDSVALKDNETADMDDNETSAGAGIGDLTGAIASDGEDLKSPKIAADIAHMEPGRTSNLTGNNDKVEVPSEVDEESCDFDYEPNVSQHVGETLLEQLDDDDNYEYEDVEVTVANDEGESSVERTEERMLQGDEGEDSTNVNKHPMKPLHEDGNDKHRESHVDFVDKRESGITKPEILLPLSGERPVNFAYRANEESIARPTNRGGNNNVSRQERTARGMVFVANGCASNQGNWRGKQNRPIMQYTGPNRSSYKKMKHNNTIPVTSYDEGRRFSKNVYRRGTPHSWRPSERSHDNQFHRPEAENSLQQFGRQRSDCTWVRGDPARIKNAQEDDFTVTSDYSIRTGGRPVKKWFRDERSDVPHPPPPSQAHNGNEGRMSGGFQNASRPMKNIGPRSRYIERDVPHFRVENDYREKFLPELQDETPDRSFSYAHKHYDQVENTRRSSHSPLHCGPMHASPSCLNSSQRPSDDQSRQHLSLHGKSPEICNGRPELIHQKPIRSRREPHFQPSLQHPRFVRRQPIFDDEGGDRPITKQPPRIVSSTPWEDDQNIGSNPEQIRGGFQPLQHDGYRDYVGGAEFDKDGGDERHAITRPLRQQLYGERQGVAESSHLRPNRYDFKKGRNGIVYNGSPVKRRH